MRVKWLWGGDWNWRVYGSSRGNTGWLGGGLVFLLHTHTAQCCLRISNIPQWPPLSVLPKPHPSASQPHPGSSQFWGVTLLTLGWKRARQFHKVSLSVWIIFLCISFSKQQPLTQTCAIISTVIHTYTKVWSCRDKPVTHAHWHMMVTHRNMNSSLHWRGLKEKDSTEIDLLLPETGSMI